MSHFITHLLVAWVLLVITKSVRQLAEKRMNGVEGRIAWMARILPLIPLGFFSTLSVYALQDPDPDDRMAGFAILVCAILLLVWLIYYWTYRLVLNDEWILVQSLIGTDRMIHLTMPFDLIVDPELKHFILRHDGKTLKVTWIVSGFREILARLIDIRSKMIF
jgi:hypothetical protein